MKIRNNGIYFKQIDQKDDGYYTEDEHGILVHHEYKKPTFWERAKFFATYGRELNLETNVTSYLYFRPDINKVYIGSMVGDAISNAKYLNSKRNFGSSHNYLLEGDHLKFETPVVLFNLEFSPDGLHIKASAKTKSNNKTQPLEVYSYLDWDKI